MLCICILCGRMGNVHDVLRVVYRAFQKTDSSPPIETQKHREFPKRRVTHNRGFRVNGI